MKKLTLDLDALRVESFDTDRARDERGTVRGNAVTLDENPTCDGGNTCWDSCDGVCGTYYCVTLDASCGQNHSCVWTCGCTHYVTCDGQTCRQCSNIWC